MQGAEPVGPRGRVSRTTVVVGLLLAAAGLAVAALVVPGRADASDAYRGARACAPDDPDRRGEDCVQRVRARVVEGPYWTGKRSSPYRIAVRKDGGSEVFTVRLDGDGREDGLMDAGDEVTLWYWRGGVQAVGYGGGTARATDGAEGSWKAPAAFAVLLTVAGTALILRGGFRMLCGRRVRRRFSWHVPVVFYPVLAAAALSAFGALAAGSPAEAYRTAAVLGGFAAVPALVVTLFCLLRRPGTDDTVEIEPRVPDGEHVVRGFVLDPAYRGCQTLIIGPGTLAASPHGNLARMPLPRDLVLGRIRRQWHTDPLGGYLLADDGNEPYYVAECRHGDGVLLIAAQRSALALLAGALGGALGGPAVR